MLSDLALGFSVAFTAANLGLCLLGCLIGTLIGVLPGIGPIATVSILLPFTFGISPVGAIIMLAGIYYGAQYGGSTTAILVRMPGEAGSIVTMLDGHAMARNGRAGAALALAALASFTAGSIATLVIGAFAQPLGKLALLLGPEDYFALIVLGLALSIALAGGSVLNAIVSVLLGVILASVGTDVETGVQRLTFGQPSLLEGIGIAVLAMGFFGVGRDHAQPRSFRYAAPDQYRDRPPLAAAATRCDGRRSPRCAEPRSDRCWVRCPAAAPCWPRSRRTCSKRSFPARRSVSERAHRKAWRDPRLRTTRPRRPASSR